MQLASAFSKNLLYKLLTASDFGAKIMKIKYNIFACVSKNMGIGKNNDLPWTLKTELDYYVNVTDVSDPTKKNVFIVGRKTYETFSPRYRDSPSRINFVLSRSKLNFGDLENVYGFNNWDEINEKLQDANFMENIESIWVIGGTEIYRYAMDSPYFYRLYLSEINQEFDCDVFFPPLVKNIRQIRDPNVSDEMQEENGIQFKYNVYENTLSTEE